MAVPELPINFEKVKEYMLQNIEFREIAKLIGVSYSTLYQRFKKKYNCTPSQFYTILWKNKFNNIETNV